MWWIIYEIKSKKEGVWKYLFSLSFPNSIFVKYQNVKIIQVDKYDILSSDQLTGHGN